MILVWPDLGSFPGQETVVIVGVGVGGAVPSNGKLAILACHPNSTENVPQFSLQ